MKLKSLYFAAATALALALAGCSAEPPKCSDEQTTSLVMKMLSESLASFDKLDVATVRKELTLEFPLATALDEKIRKYSCDANLVVAGSYKIGISYTSQLGDDSRHVVSLKEMSGLQVLPLRMALAAALTEKPAQPPAAVQASSAEITPPMNEAKSFSPSFDCAKASNLSEKAVCNEPLLGRLDGALALNYKYMMASDIGDGARSDLKATQKAWLSERNKCVDSQCLETAYRNRLEAVCEYPVISGIHPACTTSQEIK